MAGSEDLWAMSVQEPSVDAWETETEVVQVKAPPVRNNGGDRQSNNHKNVTKDVWDEPTTQNTSDNQSAADDPWGASPVAQSSVTNQTADADPWGAPAPAPVAAPVRTQTQAPSNDPWDLPPPNDQPGSTEDPWGPSAPVADAWSADPGPAPSRAPEQSFEPPRGPRRIGAPLPDQQASFGGNSRSSNSWDRDGPSDRGGKRESGGGRDWDRGKTNDQSGDWGRDRSRGRDRSDEGGWDQTRAPPRGGNNRNNNDSGMGWDEPVHAPANSVDLTGTTRDDPMEFIPPQNESTTLIRQYNAQVAAQPPAPMAPEPAIPAIQPRVVPSPFKALGSVKGPEEYLPGIPTSKLDTKRPTAPGRRTSSEANKADATPKNATGGKTESTKVRNGDAATTTKTEESSASTSRRSSVSSQKDGDRPSAKRKISHVTSAFEITKIRESPLTGHYIEASFFGSELEHDFTRAVKKWMLYFSEGHENIEIEARIGLLVWPGQNNRFMMAVENDTIMSQPHMAHFKANMTQAKYAKFNDILNQRTILVNSTKCATRIDFKHTHTLDKKYETEKYGPIRVTTDIKTKEILAACRKKAIHAINVMSPMNEFDFRISMSVEEPIDIAEIKDKLPWSSEPGRIKNRLSYQQQGISLDLTQVTVEGTRQQTHELEVEIMDFDKLVAIGRQEPKKMLRNTLGQSEFDLRIERFLSDIRALCRQ